MNDMIEQELKSVVEQVVWPIRATSARKRAIREELLAHLWSIFEEEQRRLADERAAFERAQQRFGDPGELTIQLQQAVSRWDRCQSILETMGYRPSESAWHLAARYFLVMLLIYSLWLPGWMLARGQLPYSAPAEAQRMVALAMAGLVLAVALFNVVLSVVLAPLLSKIGPLLVPQRWGRILLTVLCGSAVIVGLVLPLFTGAAVLLVFMAYQQAKQWRYQEDWA
jgi:hypothetical protein